MPEKVQKGVFLVFVFRLFAFLTGCVTLLVQSESPEKFINLAASRGIFLWDLRMLAGGKFSVRVRLSAVRPLRHVARKTKSRFRIVSREGLPFLLARLNRRRALAGGLVLFFLSVYFLGSFVWFIDVTGSRQIPAQEVKKAAAQAGLARGTPRWKINTGSLEKNIQDRLPALSWVGVYIKGTRAEIHVVEKTLVEEKEDGFAHVVAAKAGLVEEVLVLKGHPAVKEGDTVVPGQVLISGIVPLPEPEPARPEEKEKEVAPGQKQLYVAARGIVRARVWYEEYGEALLVERESGPTGRVAARVCMKIGGKEIILKGSPGVPFENYREEKVVKKIPPWRNLTPGVELIYQKFSELQEQTVTRSREQALALAGEKALAEIRQKLPQSAIILRERIEELVTPRPENVVRVRAHLEVVEDIGVNRPFSVR